MIGRNVQKHNTSPLYLLSPVYLLIPTLDRKLDTQAQYIRWNNFIQRQCSPHEKLFRSLWHMPDQDFSVDAWNMRVHCKHHFSYSLISPSFSKRQDLGWAVVVILSSIKARKGFKVDFMEPSRGVLQQFESDHNVLSWLYESCQVNLSEVRWTPSELEWTQVQLSEPRWC